MGAAEKTTANLHSMSDYPALAVFTDGRNCLDRALEAIECMPRAGGDQFKRLVVFVATNFAFRHFAPRGTRQLDAQQADCALRPLLSGTRSRGSKNGVDSADLLGRDSLDAGRKR